MLWYIGLGSALGGMSRYLLGGMVRRAAGPGSPVGTLVVNVTGSFLQLARVFGCKAGDLMLRADAERVQIW